ncbi:hypothetical protein [Nostoc sp. MG11]|uniref:hypothetical protein n=1 Tax=Nostoc sp. MG11 TaxID=2721166 RepID=UPI001865D213|nr:hypothetical protein [Nostoc sp. MG11]
MYHLNSSSIIASKVLAISEWRKKQAPNWWAQFFTQEFLQATSESELYSWGELVGLITYAFHEDTLHQLRKSYCQEKSLLCI